MQTLALSRDVPYKALQPFTLNGTNYRHDDPVDVAEVDDRLLDKLFRQRFITVATENKEPAQKPAAKIKAAPKEEPKAEPKAEEQKPTEGAQAAEGAEAMQPPAGEAASADASGAKAYAAIHKGFGRWYVEGPALTEPVGPMGKAEAESEAARLNAS